MSKANGGPAFPVESVDEGSYGRVCGSFGMSLRDYFAAKAMVALMNLAPELCEKNGVEIILKEDFAKNAYRYADAMLKERKSSES